MRYLLKQKLFPLKDDFFILDESGHNLFRVEDQTSGLRPQLSFQDLTGKELASIEQNGFTASSYEIQKDGGRWAAVARGFRLFRQKFTLQVAGQDEVLISGDFDDFEYEFTRGDRTIAQARKHSGWVLDSYEIEVMPQEDPILILASAVVIGLCRDPDSWLDWFE